MNNYDATASFESTSPEAIVVAYVEQETERIFEHALVNCGWALVDGHIEYVGLNKESY